MGLDWNPLARPRAGHEDEFARLFDQLRATDEPDEAMLERFHEISEPAFATLGAPRVGFDAAADEWLRQKLDEAGRAGELAQAIEQMRGYCVLALLPPCDGFPYYSNGGMRSGARSSTRRAPSPRTRA